MIDRIVVVLGLLLVAGLGNVLTRRRLRSLLDRRNRAVEFHNKLTEYVESRGRDVKAYNWLTMRSTGIQREIGSHGVMAKFRPPFANFMFRDWPIILNALPEMRQRFGEPFLFEQADAYAQIVKDALLRYSGALEDQIEEVEKEVLNPIHSFREGVHALLRTPMFLLYWLGLRGAPSLTGGTLGRMVSGLVALVTLASAIVSLVVGWNSFVNLLRSAL